METKFGWVLSSPAEPGTGYSHNVFVTTLHASTEDTRLEDQLQRFWDVEALGLTSTSILDSHRDNLTFDGERYTVKLPWKQPHPLLPDNYSLSLKRFRNLYKRLEVNPHLLYEYDAIIKQQISLGIVEEVDSDLTDIGNVHYLPHHAVERQDKLTTKLRIVYDASSKSEGLPSLNDCLYAGPSLNQKIFDIVLRFRTHRIGFAADVEKAFLMVAIDKRDRDYVRFLWVGDINRTTPQLKILRFTRVVFGLTSSPFLLNATIKCHMEKYATEKTDFVQKFLRSIYVDDLTSGAANDQEAKEFYETAKCNLAFAGFNLRKFTSNSNSLNQIIKQEEATTGTKSNPATNPVIKEEDTTYTKTTLGNPTNEDEKILGVRWNSTSDNFIFDITEIADYAKENIPTKRHVVSVAAKFFDPLGYFSPFIVKFKLFFQELCRTNHDWDTPLEGRYLDHWNNLTVALSSTPPSSIPRYFNYGVAEPVTNYDVIGFCDASKAAYAAVVYLRINTHSGSSVKFIASKTRIRITPLTSTSIPRLELLSALVLSRLMNSIVEALKEDLQISNTLCFTDSKVAYYWITNEAGEWKQFVQNRVNEIRTLTSVSSWRHCPRVNNPADLPSRGVDPHQFLKTSLWSSGPEWLPDYAKSNQEPTAHDNLPEIMSEMKKTAHHDVLLATSNGSSISNIIDSSTYSSIDRLFRVTSYVLRFIRHLKHRDQNSTQKISPRREIGLANEDLLNAEKLWLREIQSGIPQQKNFENGKKQFGIYADQDGILRCRGRLGNSDLPETTKFPVLLDHSHYMVTLIVRRSHLEVKHSEVAATLTQLRSKYWIIRGRQFVRKIIY